MSPHANAPAPAERLRADLARIAAATQFSPQGVTLAGRPAPDLRGGAVGLPTPAANPAIAQLEHLIYDNGFCHPFSTEPRPTPPQSFADLLPALRAANAGVDRWEPHWAVERWLPTGQFLLRKETRQRRVWPGEFTCHLGPGLPPAPGAAVSVLAPGGSEAMQPGFYFAFGSAALDDDFAPGEIVRFYWNVRPEGAPLLVARLTAGLGALEIPFRFKCLTTSAQLDRADGAVLYLRRRHVFIMGEILAELHAEVASALRDGVGLFTKPLLPGVALAEDPPGGGSFGMSRCRVVAEGLWNAFVLGFTRGEDRVAEVLRQFQRRGLDPDRPYLNPGSVDRYEFCGADVTAVEARSQHARGDDRERDLR